MERVHYRVVAHDGGWAYTTKGVFSEPYVSREAALAAAHRVAREQHWPDTPAEIEFQDAEGIWHIEHSTGVDHPEADVIE